jgi:hypothetical protein
MKVDIDLAADAVSVAWAPRARAHSQVVGQPGRAGARMYFNESGDVVGFEILGWSHRTDDPTDVAVMVHTADSAETLSKRHSLAQALSRPSIETDASHRPIQDGEPMITLAEATELTGRERSWLSREMKSGNLRALKIGRTWWTSRSWIDSYMQGRDRRRIERAASARA